MAVDGSRGVSTRRLVLIALDLSHDGPIVESLDGWQSIGLLDDVYVVSLPMTDRAELTCFRPNTDTQVSLTSVFSERVWSDVTVVSPRLAPLSRTSEGRVAAELRLQTEVRNAYPVGQVTHCTFFTLAWLNGEEFTDGVLPVGYSSHLIHDTRIFADPRLPLRQFNDQNRHLSLAFTAVLGAGGFTGQAVVPLRKVSEFDEGVHFAARVRPLRGMARAALGGWFFDDELRRSMEQQDSLTPQGVVNPIPTGLDSHLLDLLVRETATVCQLNYVAYVSPRPPDAPPVNWWAALKIFFRGFGSCIRRAVRGEVSSEIARRTQPLADALQDVLFGEHSTVVIRGSSKSGLPSPDSLHQLVSLIEQRTDAVYAPQPQNEAIKALVDISLATLDGSDLPDGIKCLTKAGRVLLSSPKIVGPSIEASTFHLSDEERGMLGLLDASREAAPDVLVPASIARVAQAIREARINQVFKSVPVKDPDPPVSANEGPRLVGTALRSRSGRLGDGARDTRRDAPTTPRSPDLLEREFDEWHNRATAEAEPTFIGRLTLHLQAQIDRAQADNKFEEWKRQAEAAAKVADQGKQTSRKFTLAAVASLVVTILASIVFSSFKIVAIAVVPFLAIGVMVWLAGFAFSFGVRVLRKAIDIRRKDLERERTESSLEALLHHSERAIREYIRLVSLQRQINVWQKIIRGIIHAPFGPSRVSRRDEQDIMAVGRPDQFLVTEVAPADEQIIVLRNHIRGRVVVKGYLQKTLDGVLGEWKSQYQQLYANNLNNSPYSDHATPWGTPTGLHRADDSPVYLPLQDFYTQIISGGLREVNAQAVRKDIEDSFRNFEVREVFAKVVGVDKEMKAIGAYSPDAYLFDYLTHAPGAKLDFDAKLFNKRDQEGVSMLAKNVQDDLGMMSDVTDRKLASFNLRAERQFVMMTYLVDVGRRCELSALSGYVQPRVVSSTPDVGLRPPT
jgi:hypothetical protein